MGNSQPLNDPLRVSTYRVKGNSMNPLLNDGDEVQVQAAEAYEVGDIVVAIHPIQTDITIIKRIESMDGSSFRLRGTNAQESTDKFGLVSRERIIGKVIS